MPLSPLAVALIKEAEALSADSPYLFPSPKDVAPIGSGAATKGMQRARPTLDLVDFRVHDLRRTAATGMRRLGVAPEVVSMILNHKRQDVTAKHYDHYKGAEEKRAALTTWALHVQALIAGV